MSEQVAPGVWKTATGTISRSETQTGWAIQTARYLFSKNSIYENLLDEDIRWLLIMGWNPSDQS